MTTTDSAIDSVEALMRASAWCEGILLSELDDPEVMGLASWRIIGMLRGTDGVSMTAIATGVGIPRPTLTRTVDRLVDTGLVHRRVDAGDRRRALLYLTRRGSEKGDTFRRAERRVTEELQNRIGSTGTADLLAHLARLD